jgi:prevent-host-death family protein
MSDTALTTVSVQDAETRFSELLVEVSGAPVGITQNDQLAAYLISRNDYEAMSEKIQFLEDQLWLAKADAARAEGRAAKKRVAAFLHDFSEGVNHEEAAIHKAGS